ncbi:hypothetical protein M959_06752, partial [Chaetura pelagica]
AHSKLTTLDFRGVDFSLFRDLLKRVSWYNILKGTGVHESWLIFKDHLLQAQEHCIPTKRKSSRNSRRSAWMNKQLLEKLRLKNEAHRGWKLGQVSREDYREVVQAVRDQVRRAKSLLELDLARDVKNNKKSFFRYLGEKRTFKESVGPLLKETGKVATQDTEKAEVLNDFFASVFSG